MPDSATLLTLDDRCELAAWHAQRFERMKMRSLDALYAAIEEGLTTEEKEPGQVAGDHIFTLAESRGIDCPDTNDLYGQAVHLAALADIVVHVLRTGGPWERPDDAEVGNQPWKSSAWLVANRTRLRRVVLVDHWTPERALAEATSWRSRGEVLAYNLPLDQVVIVLGQHRGNRRHGPWSKCWSHPLNKELRMRKRSGEAFGGSWVPKFREELDVTREEWTQVMQDDGVLADCLIQVEVAIPTASVPELRVLQSAKVDAMTLRSSPPARRLSQCYWPIPCPYSDVCPSFVDPSIRNGFIKLGG